MLEVEELSKSFGGLQAVDSVSFTVAEGEILGVIGPNGAGKSTVFNLITGFLKPDAGKVELRGKDITGAKSHEVSRYGMARTFQLDQSFANITALDSVVVGRLYGREPAHNVKQARTEAEELLNFVGIGDRRDTMACNLTLADRKKIGLATAVATRPHLLLLDEIIAGLNPVETEISMQLIKEINGSGITIMLVEHVMEAVFRISDRVIVLNVGKKITDGSPQEVANNPEVIELYLGKSLDA